MFTFIEFTSEWKRLHHPSMSVDSDVAFFYEIYVRLHRLVEQEAAAFDEQLILSLLLYTENIAAIGLDGVYEYMYRSLGDRVVGWCRRLEMKADGTSIVRSLVSDAVAEASYSSLRRWITECVLSRDFLRLRDMLVYFAREDQTLRCVYPALRYRQEAFFRLMGNGQAAWRLLWLDMAFNWQDKSGCTLSDTIARQCRLSASSARGQESSVLLETADYLSSIRSERLDTYALIGRKDGRTLTLRGRDGRVFQDVTLLEPVPKESQYPYLAAQLVTYRGKTYASGPIRWLVDEEADAWNGDIQWGAIGKKEEEDAKRAYFTTPFGKRLSLYEDLYILPEAPEEVYYASQGIYPGEPNLLDFLEWLKPAIKDY